jgi:protein ImuA
MTVNAEELSRLRAILARPGLAPPRRDGARLGCEAVDHVLQGGLLRDGLHEVFARPGHEAAATGFAAGLVLRLAAGKQVLWISQDFSSREFAGLCATGLFEFGLTPAHVLLLSVAAAEDGVRAAGDALTCRSLGAVVVEIAGNPAALDLTASRRLVLACAQHSVPAVLLRLAAAPDASAAETRWLVGAAPSAPPAPDAEAWGHPVFDASLIRNRHGRTGRWLVAWSCDDGCFRDAKAASGAVVSAPADRQTEAA